MQSELNQISFNTIEFLRPRLQKHPKLHNFTISLHRIYCNLTGFLHVLPDFYIIGAAKSGTSSLYDYLVQHPGIQPTFTKEPRFFDKYYDRGFNWYKVNFPFKFHKILVTKFLKKNFLTCDATPRYLDHPHAPQRIKKLTPNAKLIVLLRNPINRAYSNYNMRVNTGAEDLTFEKAIEREKKLGKTEFEKMLKDENYYSRDYYHYSYIDRSLYVNKLKRWMKVFPKEQFLILQSEKFFEDPSKVYNQVLKFLNLPKWDLVKYQKIGTARYKKPKLESNLRKQLVDFFEPYNQELIELVGQKFDWNE